MRAKTTFYFIILTRRLRVFEQSDFITIAFMSSHSLHLSIYCLALISKMTISISSALFRLSAIDTFLLDSKQCHVDA